jgi:hypothetical protein
MNLLAAFLRSSWALLVAGLLALVIGLILLQLGFSLHGAWGVLFIWASPAPFGVGVVLIRASGALGRP